MADPIATCRCGHDRRFHCVGLEADRAPRFCLGQVQPQRARGAGFEAVPSPWCPCRDFDVADHRAASLEACAPFNPDAAAETRGARYRSRRTA